MLDIKFNKILLVEDDPSHQFLIKRALSKFTENLEVATTVSEAKKFALSSFSLIVTDLALPDSDGITHVGEFITLSSQAPLLVLTSSNSIKFAVDAMKMGASDFLVKQFGEDFDSVLTLSLRRIYRIEEDKREKIRLEREGKALRYAIEYSADGFAVCDRSGVVLYANGAYQSYVKKIGGNEKSLSELFPEKYSAATEIRERLKKFLTVSNVESGLFSQEVKIGELTFNISVSSIGSLTVVRLQDISDLKKKEKLQRDLISTTSHDLKGPLSTVLLSTDLLLEEGGLENKELATKIARQIGSSARGAISLIEEFLSAKSIKEGVLVLHPTPCNLKEKLSEIVKEFKVSAEARTITLSLDENGGDVTIDVDGVALGRVVGNLINNAIKFTPKGKSVTVSYKDLGSEAAIAISDTGVGIATEDLPKIFGRFARVGDVSEVGGTGLGLFVVKSLTMAHGGSVDVESAPGVGTTFKVKLPKKPPVNESGVIPCLDLG